MIIQELNNCTRGHCNQNSAFTLDCVVATALLVLGTLAVIGTLSLAPGAGWALLGAGAVYATAMFLRIFNERCYCCSL